jgi:hypothetical protein
MKTMIAISFLLATLSSNALAQSLNTITPGSRPTVDNLRVSDSLKSTETRTSNAGASNSAGNSLLGSASTATVQTSDGANALKIKYTGILKGPGLNSENFAQSTGDAGEVEHRLKFLVQKGEMFDFGAEARVRTILDHKQFSALNGNYRLLADFKHLVKNDLVDFTLTPRLALPTAIASRQRGLIAAPELIANVDISPKNTRFSFNTGILMAQSILKSTADVKNTTSVIAPWFETDYQINSRVSAMIAFYPELIAQSRSGVALNNDSNELDLGANIEIAKGWSASPYIGVEAFGMKTSSLGDAAKNMQFNVTVSGSFL